ncbi:MAG: helix-turn-helix transcriptional regulator [Crenarchaeota archaeon]|nr:helix-turn-helix transcriptional regulator [Thermoproteota archaeon]
MSDLRKSVGLRIKELRQSRNLKQSQLAEKIGVETTSLCKIENGEHFPKEENIEKIANALEVDIKDLFAFTPELNKEKLLANIHSMLDKSDEKTIKLAYKVINAIVN